MSATIMTLAKLAAINAVKRNMQAQGLKVSHVERRVLIAAANIYLREHPEPGAANVGADEINSEQCCTDCRNPNTTWMLWQPFRRADPG